MRNAILTLTLTILCSTAWGTENGVGAQQQEYVDLTEITALNAFLKEEAQTLHWPVSILNKEAGALKESGRSYAFCILTVKSLDRLDAANLVLKAAIMFGSALRNGAQLDRGCVTIKSRAGRARVFIPIEVARQIGAELEENANVSQECRKNLVTGCDWKDLDALLETESFQPPKAVPAEAPAPLDDKKSPQRLTEFVLKDGRRLTCAAASETDDAYAVTDEAGRFVRLRKSDVASVIRPENLSRPVLEPVSTRPATAEAGIQAALHEK